MKELIERVRSFEIDHVPDGWPAIRMREVSALADALEQQAKQIEELSAALAEKDEALAEYARREECEGFFQSVSHKALAIQPHASLVAKIKADAVRELARGIQLGGSWASYFKDYADRIEREGK